MVHQRIILISPPKKVKLIKRGSMITDINQLDFDKEYTYADYLTWKFKERVELIKGKIFKMSSAPNRRYQEIADNLYFELRKQSQKSNYFIFRAPFNVVLSKDEYSSIVQPDLGLIFDGQKLTDQVYTGTPNLVIEMLTLENSKRKLQDKFFLYQENGITEYWIVWPSTQSIIVYHLNPAGKYIGSKYFVEEEIVKSQVLKDSKVTAGDVFGNRVEKV